MVHVPSAAQMASAQKEWASARTKEVPVTRDRITRLSLSLLTLLGSVGVGLVSLTASAPPAAAATPAPASCTFAGSGVPIVLGETPGAKVPVACTGMTPLHPYLFFETSLLLAIDPKAAPLLQGDVTSVPGLLALIQSLPEINALALTVQHSNLKGDLDFTYTLPKTNAPDPNATCPPSGQEFREGLIGCALAMIDMTTFKTVAAGSGLVQFTNEQLFPLANPTVSLSTSSAAPGATVSVSDKPGAKTYWWLATLVALTALLGGGGAAPKPLVQFTHPNGTGLLNAPNKVTVTPAVYNAPTLTPPELGGSFTVPARASGSEVVTVSLSANIEGLFQEVIDNSAPLTIT